MQNYDTSEAKLRREFEMYGPIKKIIMVHKTEDGKPRGYAFIEYEHERDMHCKYIAAGILILLIDSVAAFATDIFPGERIIRFGRGTVRKRKGKKNARTRAVGSGKLSIRVTRT